MKSNCSVPVDLDDRTDVDHRDRKIIDEHADELNEEALDVLDFQVEVSTCLAPGRSDSIE